MENIILLAQAYRMFLVQLGMEFKILKDKELYNGYADTFIDAIKSPEIGFTNAEVQTLIKMNNMFGLLEPEDLPSHHCMKLMVNKKVDMDLLEAAKTLSVTDFKESIKDKELNTQERTYKYELIKRVVETGNIKKVYGDEIAEGLKQIQQDAGL